MTQSLGGISMSDINSVAVIGAGTMGLGIAAVCANAGCNVLLLDIEKASADKAVEKMQAGKRPMISGDEALARIKTGAIDTDLSAIGEYDWICEAVIEDLNIKQDLFTKIDAHRNPNSVISTNTSGIPLKDICSVLPEELTKRLAVTHFFNPVHIMKLVELIPAENADADVKTRFEKFLGGTLNKGVVYAKDTVNFIGNRIGCFWILSGLHLGQKAIENGDNIETIDQLMGAAGLPSTGLYGLVDLIGLDVMYHVGRNLDKNLPDNDIGRQYNQFPDVVKKMFDSGQLGRKTGGGFYKVTKLDDGSKNFETFDTSSYTWRATEKSSVEIESFKDLYYADNAHGKLIRDLVGTTLCYAADLIPDIADDIYNIDNAMKWGFAWKKGPFELLDELNPLEVIAQLEKDGQPIPKMLQQLKDNNQSSFYS